jgi:heme/copper-type cytochrome/quinol oxidase subunit 2
MTETTSSSSGYGIYIVVFIIFFIIIAVVIYFVFYGGKTLNDPNPFPGNLGAPPNNTLLYVILGIFIFIIIIAVLFYAFSGTETAVVATATPVVATATPVVVAAPPPVIAAPPVVVAAPAVRPNVSYHKHVHEFADDSTFGQSAEDQFQFDTNAAGIQTVPVGNGRRMRARVPVTQTRNVVYEDPNMYQDVVPTQRVMQRAAVTTVPVGQPVLVR